MLDRIIRGGTLVDGSGAPARAGDVGVRDGRIVALGEVHESARETLDAGGCIVAPGFIDPHTHLDAQLCWDPDATPTCFHGVTTVVIGLCGFGVAPCAPGGGDYLLRSLEVVEEIPFESTSLGVPFDWTSWPEFLARLGRDGLGVNVAGFVPHSALRCFVMGDRARGKTASAKDRAAMRAELERSLAAGALGLASSRGPNHQDAYGEPVPSRFADDAELRELVQACRGRVWQINVRTKFGHDAAALTGEVEQYARWTAEAGARLSWTPFHAEPDSGVWQQVLAHNTGLAERGVEVAPQVAAQPVDVLLRFDRPSYARAVRGWGEAMTAYFELDHDGRLARLREPGLRDVLRAAPEDPVAIFAPWYAGWRLAHSPSRPDCAGLSLRELGARAGTHPVDALCDLLIDDDLATLVQVPAANRDAAGAARLVSDPGTLIGLGDSGAHVTSISNYSYPSFVLAELVRERSVLPLESAIRRMTGQPAAFLGIPGRGLLREGAAADIVVFDLEALAPGTPALAHDLPGGAARLYQAARGYRWVLVNGVPTLEDDRRTGRRPGTPLRGEARAG